MNIKAFLVLLMLLSVCGCKMSDFDVFKGAPEEERQRRIEMERALQMQRALEEATTNKYETVGSDKKHP